MIKFFRKIRQKLLNENKFSKYLIYAIGEIVLVVIGILIALQLNNWKETESNRFSEQKVLSEIKNGIWRDLADFEGNVMGHHQSLNLGRLFKDYINQKEVNQDSLSRFYSDLFKTYSPVINKSGYESLKSNGLKTISNDLLRFQIVQLYDYYYTLIELAAGRQSDLQAFSNYNPLISKLYPYMEFDESGELIGTSTPELNNLERKELLRYLDLIIQSREYLINRYGWIKGKMKLLSVNIDKQLGQYIPPEELQQYTGTYEFQTEENGETLTLKGRLTFSVEDHYLTGVPLWIHSPRSFRKVAPDQFSCRSGRGILLRFIRDADQNITGFDEVTNKTRRYIKIQ